MVPKVERKTRQNPALSLVRGAAAGFDEAGVAVLGALACGGATDRLTGSGAGIKTSGNWLTDQRDGFSYFFHYLEFVAVWQQAIADCACEGARAIDQRRSPPGAISRWVDRPIGLKAATFIGHLSIINRGCPPGSKGGGDAPRHDLMSLISVRQTGLALSPNLSPEGRKASNPNELVRNLQVPRRQRAWLALHRTHVSLVIVNTDGCLKTLQLFTGVAVHPFNLLFTAIDGECI